MREPGRTTRPLSNPRRRAFTLIELLVVISIILLLATVALPSIVKLFTAGSESQAFNILAAQVLAARAQAIQKSTYAAVHIQRADPNSPSNRPGAYAAVMILAPNGLFHLAPGYQPRRMPGMIAFGELSDDFVDFDTGMYNFIGGTADDFTSLTIVFAANGSIVRDVNLLDAPLIMVTVEMMGGWERLEDRITLESTREEFLGLYRELVSAEASGLLGADLDEVRKIVADARRRGELAAPIVLLAPDRKAGTSVRAILDVASIRTILDNAGRGGLG